MPRGLSRGLSRILSRGLLRRSSVASSPRDLCLNKELRIRSPSMPGDPTPTRLLCRVSISGICSEPPSSIAEDAPASCSKLLVITSRLGSSADSFSSATTDVTIEVVRVSVLWLSSVTCSAGLVPSRVPVPRLSSTWAVDWRTRLPLLHGGSVTRSLPEITTMSGITKSLETWI